MKKYVRQYARAIVSTSFDVVAIQFTQKSTWCRISYRHGSFSHIFDITKNVTTTPLSSFTHRFCGSPLLQNTPLKYASNRSPSQQQPRVDHQPDQEEQGILVYYCLTRSHAYSCDRIEFSNQHCTRRLPSPTKPSVRSNQINARARLTRAKGPVTKQRGAVEIPAAKCNPRISITQKNDKSERSFKAKGNHQGESSVIAGPAHLIKDAEESTRTNSGEHI
ncbi:hypothetical protein BJ742DRAFT_319057 [Cladochytrium replicatum]|nr:hypothetical protein BJ742DRAFT_319057 [Cladochytrium replicatum]